MLRSIFVPGRTRPTASSPTSSRTSNRASASASPATPQQQYARPSLGVQNHVRSSSTSSSASSSTSSSASSSASRSASSNANAVSTASRCAPDLDDIENWGPNQVRDFLLSPAVGITKIPKAFVDREPTGKFLKSLQHEDLQEFKFLKSEVRKIIAALNRVPFWGTPLCKTPRSTFYEVPVSFLVEKFEPETFYQRPPNPARYEHMATVKLASGADPHFMGVISCFDFGNNPLPASQKQPRGVLDGQHRVEAMRIILQEKRKFDPTYDFNVVIEVFPVRSGTHLGEYFSEVNKAESVQLSDFPDSYMKPYTKLAQKLLNEIMRVEVPITNKRGRKVQVKWQNTMFKTEFKKPNGNPRSPHVKPDVLRHKLVESGFIQFHCNVAQCNQDPDSINEEQVVQAMFDHIMSLNDELRRTPVQRWSVARVGTKKEPLKHYNKAKAHNFFLGLDPNFEWLSGYTRNVKQGMVLPAHEGESKSDDDSDDETPNRVTFAFACNDRVDFKEAQRFCLASSPSSAATVIRCHDDFHKGVPLYDLCLDTGEIRIDVSEKQLRKKKKKKANEVVKTHASNASGASGSSRTPPARPSKRKMSSS
eukprot:INCI15458.2.p1 GENE.INCI15458.2~~INCI15458.2.p1  ORF type:complete len:591 (-),score=114.04 INCI15458.2:203-1975(-)